MDETFSEAQLFLHDFNPQRQFLLRFRLDVRRLNFTGWISWWRAPKVLRARYVPTGASVDTVDILLRHTLAQTWYANGRFCSIELRTKKEIGSDSWLTHLFGEAEYAAWCETANGRDLPEAETFNALFDLFKKEQYV